MNKVLIVSYVFPPMAAVGGFRVIKACKFLPEFGWQPVVLTVKEGFNYAYDHSLLNQLDPSLKVYRSPFYSPWDKRPKIAASSDNLVVPLPAQKVTSSTKPSFLRGIKRYVKMMLSLPDSQNFWIPSAVWTGLKAIRREKIDLIMTTSPPASAHLIGCCLSFLTGKPLVVDFRDLWTQNEAYDRRNLPKLFRVMDRFIEKRVLKRAKIIVAATEEFSMALCENNRFKGPEACFSVTNGVDPDDFSNVTFPPQKNDHFTILHLGSLYGNRNPAFFFNVVEHWAKQRPEIVGKTKILFIGNAPNCEKLVTGAVLPQMVNFSQHIPQQQVLSKLWEADMLLLILGFAPEGRGVMPAKLFEYLCTGRNILAFVPEGVAADAIRKYERGQVVTSEDIAATIAYLDREFDAWLNQKGPKPSQFSLPVEYDRRLQNKKLAEILNQLL